MGGQGAGEGVGMGMVAEAGGVGGGADWVGGGDGAEGKCAYVV